ncbi:hypothetical protein N7474_001047 [Penicillium riverlandense]|uniref:uncharacterized protein n=1 Tax=Penicillium riverlandense TaxID=1903569 RepID=UPI00254919C1|nr:uncharacterized protein N7474_001047 [Penicillium riverlandense]KAJ5832736.1 hypothetical protein N7474_001047 [Penicillium riverlandense]
MNAAHEAHLVERAIGRTLEGNTVGKGAERPSGLEIALTILSRRTVSLVLGRTLLSNRTQESPCSSWLVQLTVAVNAAVGTDVRRICVNATRENIETPRSKRHTDQSVGPLGNEG